MFATFRTDDNSISSSFPLQFIRVVHGLQNPIISSCSVTGKLILWNGDSQSARKFPPWSRPFFEFRPKTSITPDNAVLPPFVLSPPPFRRSILVIFVKTTPDWSNIMQLVKRPNRMDSTNNPIMFTICVGLSKHVKCCDLMCPCRPRQSKNRKNTRLKEYTHDRQV